MKDSFSIADWTVEPQLNVIIQGDERVHLEPKVMRVLLHLAAHPGEVQTKQQLIEAVWPDAFVTDDVLTRCISLLRRVMRDDIHTPRYIQTIPKTGYLLVASVRHFENVSTPAEDLSNHGEPGHATAHGLISPVQGTAVQAVDTSETVQERTARSRQLRIWQAVVGVLLLAGTLAGATFWVLHRRAATPSFRVISLTSYAGQQDQAAFSPDGARIAFVWTSADDGNRNVFIKQIGNETLLRMTQAVESDYSPVWSPDGSQIAYLAISSAGLGIYSVSSLGGPAQKLYTPKRIIHWEQGGLSWSPDGKSLIYADGVSAGSPSSIYVMPLNTQQPHAITSPPSVWDGDLAPVYSPDGTSIAFIRAIEGAVRDIYVMPATGGEPKQITRDGKSVDSLAWTSDSRSIIFSSDRGGKFALWKVSGRGGNPARLPFGTEDAFQPAISSTAHRLLYSQRSATWSILGFHLNPEGVAGKAETVISSTQQDSAPTISPDGSRFAFQSWRSGSQELWLSSRDGLNLRQLTVGGNALTGSPAFSLDGQQIAFDSRPDGHSHIFVVPAGGGAPRALTSGSFNDILPRWSVDGRSIYFASNRSGSWQSWRISVGGGEPRQVTKNGSYVAAESMDGKWIYYTKSDVPGIWRVPIGGGPEARILAQPRAGYWGYWSVAKRGVYLLDSEHSTPRIALYDPATGRSTTVVNLSQLPPNFAGISISSNEQELLVTDERNAESHITLVENLP